MKNNIDYYMHEVTAHQHAKFKMLRVKYGWEGEGRFWALNSLIGQAENCLLDLSKKFIRANAAVELDMTIEEFDQYVDYLIKDCELLVDNSGVVTTKSVQEVLAEVSKKRQRNKKQYESRFQLAENQNQPSENIQSKVKESKVNNTTQKVIHRDGETVTLKDGSRAVKRFGEWYDANNPTVRMDLGYYSELKDT
jgi:hypothetical protein